ncbi:MAG: GH36-type glycosyl hydrolase domain-containing protein [Verrucomicrobiales bacterium]
MRVRHPQLLIRGNSRLRSIATPVGRGALFFEWISLSRWQEAAPSASGPFVYLSEGGQWTEHANAPSLGIESTLAIEVHPELDMEIRRLTLRDLKGSDRQLQVSLATEVALHHPMGDAGHPAFAKLFVQTEAVPGGRALLARRRPRGSNEHWPWYGQMIGGDLSAISWQTNRVPCIGRGRGWDEPALMDSAEPLSGETGNVLDPVFCWRGVARVPASGEIHIYVVSGCDRDRGKCIELLEARDSHALVALFADAVAAREAKEKGSGLSAGERQHCEGFIATLLGADPEMKAPAPDSADGADAVHFRAPGPEQSRLVLAGKMESEGGQWLSRALPYWRSLGLDPRVLVQGEVSVPLPDGFEAVAAGELTPAALAWLSASAQLVVGDKIPALPEAASEVLPTPQAPAFLDMPLAEGKKLAHWNGHGGFTEANEYAVVQPMENGRLKRPPMPWINVLANERFGCLVSDSGAGYTWARNSQANRLSPWSNDPVRDPHTEAIYLRDPATGRVWSPLPGPCRAQVPCLVTHGHGTTRFVSEFDGLKMETTFVVPPDDAVKLIVLRIENKGSAPRELDAAHWMDLVMASQMDRHHATLAWTGGDGISRAVNPRAGDFHGGIAFAAATVGGIAPEQTAFVHSRSAMFGPLLDRRAPRCWDGIAPGAERGFGRDAGFGRAFRVSLEGNGSGEIVFLFGEAMSESEISAVAAKYLRPQAAEETINRSLAFWKSLLGKVQIQTPLPGIDRLVNGWLLYQNLACRIWGRSAFYQSGGAYGFRDQLQDSGSLATLRPELFRAQILLHAANQFREGDVLHWWHPEPMNRGMRTNFSDDLLWLPYLLCHYLETTGDASVFDEVRPFLTAEPLPAGEDEKYMKPEISGEIGTVFEHACRSIDRSLTRGAHGLPLMGIGDWNDGMSRIGREGKGESVWLGFFLHDILGKWIPLCCARGETTRAETYERYLADLRNALQTSGWDGAWYRRAYYDDGTPLGTIEGDECIIDALAQAWAVISKAAPPDRAGAALDALEARLVDSDAGIIRLLTPPFVDTPHDPGYIKGYVAGVRENGGQYTHAACWVVRAMAEAGRRDTAAALLEKMSPVWHTRDEKAVARYQTEPYVIVADIYGASPHVGRGGWSWYTGSAGWFHRVVIESVLGLTLHGGKEIKLAPRIPDAWPGYSITWTEPDGKTSHVINVRNSNGAAATVRSCSVDGKAVSITNGSARWPIFADGASHAVEVELG